MHQVGAGWEFQVTGLGARLKSGATQGMKLTSLLMSAFAAAALTTSMAASAQDQNLPEEAQTYLRLRFGSDVGQLSSVTQLAKAYLRIADAPVGTWGSKAHLAEAAVELMRGENCVRTRFAKSGLKASEVSHNLQRVLLSSGEKMDGWNRFVEAYAGRMPPKATGDTCD